MELYLLGERGGLKKISKVDFKPNNAYLIDDIKTIYIWFGKTVPEKKRNFCSRKAELLNEKRSNSANVLTIEQGKEYGSFLAIKDLIRKGKISTNLADRRPELEIRYEETKDFIEAGLKPDFEGELTIDAHEIALEKKSYEELCRMLAELQLSLEKGGKKPTKKEIDVKTKDIFKSSTTYDEVCWLIAELRALKRKV